ncbi:MULTISPECIES: hypothetical protein [Bacillus]|uniref:hypothetical protein n=1 Tax=Bacillus TaxID=1386 RepID=UPI000618297E|nr:MULTISPECIES: hypothetical protein [Bacillus]KKB93968.1 hypothetical protein WB24_00385 [Bacillus sp. CMAA 1185]MBC9023235.1 hypothetical protein [Bacillus subtilis]MBW7636500.1 hypothetical protein [Bacillus licheniformis]MCA0105692.1 hypothetical protein [Bacillus subtilis]MCA1180091.1 hypothetical protein [Bacillus licheniformis]
MGVYLVTYDLNKSGQNYDGLYKKLKQFKDYKHIMESCWLIQTNNNADGIFEHLKSELDSNDRLLITRITADRQGWLSKDHWQWIRDRL